MNIFINSSLTTIPESVKSVGDLLDFLRISRLGTGIGINNRLVVNRDWDKTILNEEDRVMIISATYGG